MLEPVGSDLEPVDSSLEPVGSSRVLTKGSLMLPIGAIFLLNKRMGSKRIESYPPIVPPMGDLAALCAAPRCVATCAGVIRWRSLRRLALALLMANVKSLGKMNLYGGCS